MLLELNENPFLPFSIRLNYVAKYITYTYPPLPVTRPQSKPIPIVILNGFLLTIVKAKFAPQTNLRSA